MKIIDREEIGNSKAGPLIAYEFELDTDIQVEHIRIIVDTIIKSRLVNDFTMICISGDDYNLRFDSMDELFDYIDNNNLDDATHYIQETMHGLQILGFGFELRTNRMNISLRRHGEVEVLQLIKRIEAALLGDSAEAPSAPGIPEPAIPQPQPPQKTQTCPKCGKTVHEGHLFCCHCGADMRIPMCRFCGKEIPENAAFCPWCGKAQADQ